MNKKNKTEGKIFNSFFSHPAVGIIGSISSIISIFLAFYFFIQSEKYPQLKYSVNPVKAIVVKSYQASKLNVYYNNNNITTDITAVQIAIWNNGKQPIRKENLLTPIILTTENNSPILEATVRKYSREVIDFSIKQDSTNFSKIIVDWKIMEYNDWVIIQLIYAGDPNLDIILTGVIEGQSNIEKYKYSGDIKSAQDQITERQRGNIIVSYIFISLGLFFLLPLIYLSYRKKKQNKIEKELEEFKLTEKDFMKVYERRLELYSSISPSNNFFFKILFRLMEKIEPFFMILGILFAIGSLLGGLYFLYVSTISNLPFTF